ncbi:hypothetical protein AB0D47_26910 [Streptomyces sp. NPDC048376]|uniref:hypothetical protein n=1 Tax=Streptomyces sp. NPDC048376 TaxID=3154926 RepID=UPI00342D3DAF
MSYPTLFTTPGVRQFAEEIDAERQRQLAKFGEQHHPDGTGRGGYMEQAETARTTCQMDAAITDGGPRWSLILLEEVYEALAESGPDRLRAELVQVAAVCAAWIADLDSRVDAGARQDVRDHVCNSVVARGHMDEPLGYQICGFCGTPKDGAQR